MKFAYLIFVHRNADQFIRLVKRLDTADSLFFVHVDKKANEEEYKKVMQFVDAGKFVWLRRWNIVWAGFNSMRATLHGLEEVARHPDPISHISFISGQDYPLKPVESYHRFLAQAGGKSFLEYAPLPRPGWQNGGLDRIHYYHFYFPSFKLVFPPVSFLKAKLPYAHGKKWNVLKKIIPFIPSVKKFPRKFLEGYKPYEGSSWFTFSLEMLKEILKEVQANKAFYNYFRYTQCSDEIFFQTLIVNRLPFLLEKTVNDNLRYIVFDKNTGRPFDNTLEHFDAFKQTDAFFARKFVPGISDAVMKKIDEELLNYKEEER